jgi:hypothetical protein
LFVECQSWYCIGNHQPHTYLAEPLSSFIHLSPADPEEKPKRPSPSQPPRVEPRRKRLTQCSQPKDSLLRLLFFRMLQIILLLVISWIVWFHLTLSITLSKGLAGDSVASFMQRDPARRFICIGMYLLMEVQQRKHSQMLSVRARKTKPIREAKTQDELHGMRAKAPCRYVYTLHNSNCCLFIRWKHWFTSKCEPWILHHPQSLSQP